MKTPLSCRSLFTTAALALALASAAHGQSFYMVEKVQAFQQTSSAGSVPDQGAPFVFSADAASNVTLTLPGGATQALTLNPNDNPPTYGLSSSFTTKAALDAAYPNGTYRLAGSGINAYTLNLTPESYPAANPQVTGGTWSNGVLVVVPSQANTVNLSTFSDYSTGVGHCGVRLQGLNDQVNLRTEVATQAIFGLTASATPLTTLTIPAGTLTSGRIYEAQVQWDRLTTLDTTTNSGSGGVAIFNKTLRFYVAAAAAGSNFGPPTITAQPTNQAAVLGSRATFNFGFNPGTGTSGNNTIVVWSANGIPVNLDGTKFSMGNGGGLIINNVTAADAGNYTATVIGAGGLVTSSTAALTIATSAAPTFSRQPSTQTMTVAAGSTFVLSATAVGAPTPTYQWQRNGVNIPGATNATLLLSGANSVSGSYAVVASNGVGTPVTSTATPLNVIASADPGRLINLAILTQLTASETITMGTVLGGAGTSGPKPLLARAGGPSLSVFNLTGLLPNPKMTLTNTTSAAVTVATAGAWGGSTTLSDVFQRVGAFAYSSATSTDSAIYQPALNPGNYTVQIGDSGNGAGWVIAELYDATPSGTFSATTPRLINVSVLKQIASGATLTAGFVIGGTTAKTVLIRAVGPRLGVAPFSIPSAMAAPTMTLTNVSNNTTIATNAAWGGDPVILQAANTVGAFAVTDPASKDAMLLLTLPPANYTAAVSPAQGTAGGTAIVEVYEVP